jgi:glycosyltransferase involved in cell wall biosynthesis
VLWLKKRILIVSTSFPETKDGSEAAGSFVSDFVRELTTLASVSVLAPGTQTEAYLDSDVDIHRFRVPRQPLSLLKPHNPLDWLPIAQTLTSGQKALDALTASQRFDHVLALWALPSGYWARHGRNPIPYSIWALGSDIWTLGKIPLVRGVLQRVLRDASMRFADGVALAESVSSICGKSCQFLPSSRLLSTNDVTPRIATAPFRLAFLGRFHPNKGIDLLLESLSYLDQSDWDAISEIRIAGGGPLLPSVEKSVSLLRAKGLPVLLEGYKDRSEARELLSWADMVLIPSRIESIPVIFSDAMQLGKPVIAMPVGDLPALINTYRVGAVAEQLDPRQYAQLLTPPALRATASLGPNTRGAAEQFSVATSALNFMASLCDLPANQARVPRPL